MCGGTLMDADNFTTHKKEHRDISLSIVHDLPQSIPQPTILWWVPPDIQSDFPSDSLITHKEENTRISISSMVDKMNAFNACSLNYVAIQGKLIQAALLLLRALSHINVNDADGQNAVENHLVNNMFVNKKLIKLLVIAGEKIGHSYPFRGSVPWICWLEGCPVSLSLFAGHRSNSLEGFPYSLRSHASLPPQSLNRAIQYLRRLSQDPPGQSNLSFYAVHLLY